MERILGRVVRERRGKTGMTQARLAEFSGMTQAAISRLERECMPTFPLLERISRAFEATLLVTVEPGRGVTVTFADPDDGLRQGSETRIRNGLLPGQRNGGAVAARAS
ncbi:helix-turn-helix transcriptional regulator [Streptomyces pseudogriseolus]|uniref:helix-turn-helix transcriptional regulator n=1 Tax=Streptomyces pseudogriseolus TaxID=36817 RepID=UPI003FA2D2CF